MPPTLKQVAKNAGVAPSTASGILTGRSDSWASESTRKRVLEAAEQLGYRANQFARGLRTGTFQSVGLLVPDLLNPIYTVYARAIEETLEKSGYSLMVEESKADLPSEKRAVQKLIASQVDGLLCFFMDMNVHKKAFLKDRPKSLSVVFFGQSFPNSGIDSVIIDFGQGTIEAVEELIALGHKRIALLYGRHPNPGKDRGQRFSFFKAVLEKRNIAFSEDNFILSGHTIDDAYQRFGKYLSETPKKKRATAIFAMNDVVAMGAMRAIYDAGLSIPHDISIIGVDNTPLSRYLPVSLTSVNYPTREIAKTAADFLISRMKGDDCVQREVRFSTNLIRRESIGPVPSAK